MFGQNWFNLSHPLSPFSKKRAGERARTGIQLMSAIYLILQQLSLEIKLD
jgi:hypothetical protein